MGAMSAAPSKNADFSKPLEQLKTCHQRILAKCEALRELATRLKERGCDESARQAAAGIVRYFDTAVHYHHEDEEEDLLPRMMTAATIGRGSKLTRLVTDITSEHQVMDREWAGLRAALEEISAGEGAALDALAVDRLIKLYHSHIAIEEASVFPLAEMLLSSSDLAEIGAAMAERRGAAEDK